MNARRQFAVLMILLLSLFAPAMACAEPAAQMSAPERACCLKMHGQCDSMMNMPANHGCCQRVPPGAKKSALTVSSNPVSLAYTLQPAHLPLWQLAVPDSGAPRRLEWIQTATPESPPRPVLHLRV